MTFKTKAMLFAAALSAAAALAGCAPAATDAHSLVGAWRSEVRFSTGPFAAISDLEFMYVIHDDGTLSESSNYDAAPPVPPAYGVWRETEPGHFQTHYEFYLTKPLEAGGNLAGGWMPAGRGVLEEDITLAADGRSFTSTLHLQILDANGQPTPDTGEAQTHALRIDFPAE